MSALQPCPFCGSFKIDVAMDEEVDSSDELIALLIERDAIEATTKAPAMECGDCGARGPTALMPSEMRLRWNERRSA